MLKAVVEDHRVKRMAPAARMRGEQRDRIGAPTSDGDRPRERPCHHQRLVTGLMHAEQDTLAVSDNHSGLTRARCPIRG